MQMYHQKNRIKLCIVCLMQLYQMSLNLWDEKYRLGKLKKKKGSRATQVTSIWKRAVIHINKECTPINSHEIKLSNLVLLVKLIVTLRGNADVLISASHDKLFMSPIVNNNYINCR